MLPRCCLNRRLFAKRVAGVGRSCASVDRHQGAPPRRIYNQIEPRYVPAWCDVQLDIHVAVDANQVSISAEVRKEKEEKKGETVLRSERYYGMRSRSFMLMHDVDQTMAEARYQDGILELTLPKKNGMVAKELTVK